MYANSKRVRVDEKYNDSYQNRQGQPIDTYWGLEDLGFYAAG